ncbi:hypothetical protein M0R45_017244 [Rubus argutus]|uniref:Pentatricopeptide repeat-containing protein n=1 Tax=Rubus argutus TaxID=59490 RepID=A0AAW1XXE3_RUBAR
MSSITHRSLQPSPDLYTKLIGVYARDRELQSARLLHAHLITNGLARLTHFASKLIDLYAACGQGGHARNVFDEIPQTNVRRWLALIGAYARFGFYQQAMDVFCDMQRVGSRPNRIVIPSVLKACGHLSDVKTGEKLHAAVLRHSFEFDAFISSALIDMYSKNGRVEKARLVFDRMVEKDLVALNTVVLGFCQHGLAEEAMDLVEKMKLRGMKPNLITWNTLVAGFSQKGDEAMASSLFNLMRKDGIEPDVVSWTSVISGFVKNFQNNKAFHTFKQMLEHRICPTSATISSLLRACAAVTNLRSGKEIHAYALVIGVEADIYVRSALVDMYAKCGFIYEAKTLFRQMSERNTVTWNSMIFGYANHGYCTEAFDLFNKMKLEENKKLDYLTFVAVLTACCHAGMIELGKRLFYLMQEEHGIMPRLEHYACMVNLLGRAGQLTEAYDMIKSMPMEPDLFVWGALLGASRNYGNIELAEVAAKHLSELEPESAGNTLLLSSLYADAGNWVNVARLKKMMKKKKLRKLPGCSWTEAA